MAKFRIRLKLQALELEIDGEREDIAAISAAVQQQFAGLVQPSEAIAEGHKELASSSSTTIEGETKGRTRTGGKKRSSRSASTDSSGNTAIDFRHDSARFGSPQQGWSVAQKCVWLLYVLTSTGSGEATAQQLTATFNAQFKAAGKLHPPNVTRDLSRAKVGNPAPLGEDKGKWFLTEEGKRQAEELVNSGLAPKG
ncbi:MAG TPA: hypothetical protein VGD64_13450 [Acidisarcina sp.]